MSEETGIRITTKEMYHELMSLKETHTVSLSELKNLIRDFREENIKKQNEIISHQKETNGKVKQNRCDIDKINKRLYGFVLGLGTTALGIIGFLIKVIFF